MLKYLALNNFKVWEKLEIEFGRVTGVFGANSTGKSSLLQWLLLLKQTKAATDRGLTLDFGGPDQHVNLGTYRDVVHNHDQALSVCSLLKWQLPKTLRISNPEGKRTEVLFSGDDMEIESIISENDLQLRTELTYRFSDQSFSLQPKGQSRTSYKLKPDRSSEGNFHFVRTQGRVWDLPGPVKNYLFPDQAKTYYKNADFLSAFEFEYESLLDRLFYLGPLREYPKREYRWAGARPEDVGLRGERTIDAILAATARDEKRNLGYRTRLRPFQEIIAHWLRELGLIHSFSIKEIVTGSNLYQAWVKQEPKSPEALLTDVGFGVSQVLPALVLLYYVPEGSTIMMEQPEIHLHPSVQSGLADVMLAAAGSRNLQVIVESHSEHLLRRLQRRVAEGNYRDHFVRLYFCRSRGSVASIEDLELNMFGEIENWPDSFFGDELGEIAAIQKAGLMKRKGESSG
ncbi:MAG: DUF3696 domain-containing protein [Candidatus Tectomicrobia bacterium]|nr:DUF3696 domain-containing protein [Candidatus Tectomicrobia bacterium]